MYEHNVFVSYRRFDQQWIRWTRDNFCQALESLLRPRIGGANVFMDLTIETGNSWPQSLARNLARSRLMVSILSRDYFQSDWCTLEIALMREREKAHGYRTVANPNGLIIPVVIDDGESFPDEIRQIQSYPFHDFANPFIRIDSPRQENLAEALRIHICEPIEHALSDVPAYDPAWEEVANRNFAERFRIAAKKQTTLPAPRVLVTP